MAVPRQKCVAPCGQKAVEYKELEEAYKKFVNSPSNSLLKKHLNPRIYQQIRLCRTAYGANLLSCVRTGFENLDSSTGIYAADPECYDAFAPLFDPIIEDYHLGFKPTNKQPKLDWGDLDSLRNVDPSGHFVLSTRVRCGRAIEGYPFAPLLTEQMYKEMEINISHALFNLEGELNGTYYPLTDMTKEMQDQLIADHFLFKEGDKYLESAGACRFWPTGRGIFHNDNKTFLVWCNEEDHLRIISMQQGGDLGAVYRRLADGVTQMEKYLKFARHRRLGYLTLCPTNLGTTIRASVHIRLPTIGKDEKTLKEIAGRYNLQVRGVHGEHSESSDGVYDLSNKRRLGLTEYEAVKEMHDGILELIKMEAPPPAPSKPATSKAKDKKGKGKGKEKGGKEKGGKEKGGKEKGGKKDGKEAKGKGKKK